MDGKVDGRGLVVVAIALTSYCLTD